MAESISILLEKDSWIIPHARNLQKELIERNYKVSIANHPENISEGWTNFILGFTRIVPTDVLQKNKHNLVVHESDLPGGKGFAPMTWQILGDENDIPICLIEATSMVDSGDIWLRDIIKLKGNELCEEWRILQGKKTIEMCLRFVDNYNNLISEKQKGKSSFFQRRAPKDSELDINLSIEEQFNLLRVADNHNYPAYFKYRGRKYKLTINLYEE